MLEPSDLQDDRSIPDEEGLYRSVHRDQVKPDGSPNSAAFKHKPHISVDRNSLCDPSDTLRRHPHHVGVVEVEVGEVRSVTIGVASAPLLDNPAHANIIRDQTMTDSQWARKAAQPLARACRWAISPSS